MSEAIDAPDGARLARSQSSSGAFSATDANGTTITAADYDKASNLTYTSTTPGGSHVTLQASYSPAEAEGDHQQRCVDAAQDRATVSCEIVPLSDGRVALISMHKEYRLGGEWVGIAGDITLSEISEIVDTSDISFMRQVKVITGTQTITFAAERVQAHTLSLAQSEWELSPASLTTMAADPEVGVNAPPNDSGGCPWVTAQSPGEGTTETSYCSG